MSAHPLIVDLDGTLIYANMLHESALKVFGLKPLSILVIPYWLAHSKAYLKGKLALLADINPSLLPYNQELLTWLKQQRAHGRKLILCTGSHVIIAEAIASHLEIFDEVIASDNSRNLSGKQKAEVLEQHFGNKGFDYIGNSRKDLHVWKSARRAIVVNASQGLSKKATQYCEVERTFPKNSTTLATCSATLRVHQWVKNLLLFIPLLASHKLINQTSWIELLFAFISFSLGTSAIYIINDLLDLESDRQHHIKRKRPFALGLIPTWTGVILAALLITISFSLTHYVNEGFLKCLAFYAVLTSIYSLKLKRFIIIDCLTLAVLYTMRIIAGGAATHIDLSFWLLAFSVFLFLSLAFVKRYVELTLQRLDDKNKISGRGYYASDAPLIQVLGVASGFTAILVLTLYLNSDIVLKLYKYPELIWAEPLVILFWVSWMWMQAQRGKIHDDPLAFAIKDKASLLAGVVFSIILIISAVGWP